MSKERVYYCPKLNKLYVEPAKKAHRKLLLISELKTKLLTTEHGFVLVPTFIYRECFYIGDL